MCWFFRLLSGKLRAHLTAPISPLLPYHNSIKSSELQLHVCCAYYQPTSISAGHLGLWNISATAQNLFGFGPFCSSSEEACIWICLGDSHQLCVRSFPQRSRSGSRSPGQLAGRYAAGGTESYFLPEKRQPSGVQSESPCGRVISWMEDSWPGFLQSRPRTREELSVALKLGGSFGENSAMSPTMTNFMRLLWYCRVFLPADNKFRFHWRVFCGFPEITNSDLTS